MLTFMRLEKDAKFEVKLTYGLENNMRNLANIYHTTRKLGLNWGFYGALLSQVENVWA